MDSDAGSKAKTLPLANLPLLGDKDGTAPIRQVVDPRQPTANKN
jgi:hypothetical protein